MKRLLYKKLLSWKNKKGRMPLILRGARQVGKSYLLIEFGKNEFSHCYHFDFEKDGKDLIPLFNENLSPKKIIDNLSVFFGKQIKVHDTLIIFDEIQNCQRALTSLKYFYEDLPDLAVACAGSLLGITLSDQSFPVGKVVFLDLFPMNFEEFLMNCEKGLLYDAFINAVSEKKISSVAHTKLWECLKEYYVIGGMPAVVRNYLTERGNKVDSMHLARITQQELLDTYIRDFSKHSGKINAVHISSVFQNISRQLAECHDSSVRRYRFKDVIHGKKSFAELDGPIGWLVKTGLVLKVNICNKAELPLMSFCKSNLFKLYLFDIGLLGCMLDLSPRTLLLQDYGMTKGFFAENFVACELAASGEKHLYSWIERNSEIEFIKDFEDCIIPVEVKSGKRTKSKSLRQYMFKYGPECAIKISAKPLNMAENIKDIPLYLSGKLSELI